MAILGFNVILSLVAASVLQKILPRYSLGRWLLSSKRLHRYLHPTNQELKTSCGLTNASSNVKGNRKRKQDKMKLDEEESFLVPRNADITLESHQIDAIDVLQLPFYVDYRWLVDFAGCAMIVYSLTEAVVWGFPKISTEFNLSPVWCLILVGFSLKSLAGVTALYFQSGSQDTAERSMCLACGAIFFLLTMVVFLFTESTFELNLLKAYENFTANAAEYISKNNINWKYTRSPILLYFMMSIFYGFVGGLLTFPCLRFSRMYLDALRYAASSPLLKLLLHSSFLGLLFSLALWIKPLARSLVDSKTITDDQLESLRLWSMVACVAVRLSVLWPCLQAYLNIAYDRVTNMKNEAGKINNLELQRMIARIFFYLCVTAIQFFSPCLLLLAFTLLLKTWGNYSWSAIINVGGETVGAESVAQAFIHNITSPRESVAKTAMDLRHLFTTTFHRGLWSFNLFWTGSIILLLNCLGVVYHSRFGEKSM